MKKPKKTGKITKNNAIGSPYIKENASGNDNLSPKKRAFYIISGVIFLLLAILLFSFFGKFDYCWTDDLSNPHPIIMLCLTFNLILPLCFILIGFVLIFNGIKGKETL